MKHLVLGVLLAALTACIAGVDPTVQCPNSKEQMSREQWQACYGYQDRDSSGGR